MLATHPNAGGVLILGLGCESNQLSSLLEEIPAVAQARVRLFAAQQTGDETEEGLRVVEELVRVVEQDRREPFGLDALSIGLKCGDSDGFSGITANPLLGRIADRVTPAAAAPQSSPRFRKCSAPNDCCWSAPRLSMSSMASSTS